MLTRANNNLIKDLKKQKRQNSSLLFLDNIKIIKDAISSGLNVKYIFVENENLNIFNTSEEKTFIVDKKTIEQLSDSRTPQGVVCIMEYIPHNVVKPKTNFLVIDGMQDPGNVGTLIRTAKACGFEYIYLIDSVKITNSKLVRSSVGAIFNNNIFSITRSDFIKHMTDWNLPLLKADMNGENIFTKQFDNIVGVVIGNEGQGVSEQISKICNVNVSIPMKPGIESLNASVSGAIIMYQIAKDAFI